MPAEKQSERGKLVGEAKRDSKIRADFEITGPMRDWLTVIRPLQHIVRDHAEIMVEQGVMSDAESVRWINLHWEKIVGEPDGITSGGAIIAYGRERRTELFVDVRRESNVGYERLRLKAWTYIMARSGAGEDELDLDDLSIAGAGRRRAERNSHTDLPSPDAAEPPAGAMEDDEDIWPFGHIEVEEDEPGEERDPDDLWVRVDYDPETFAEFLEGRQELGKGEKSEAHQRLEDLLDRAKRRREEQEQAGAEEPDDAEEFQAEARSNNEDALARSHALANNLRLAAKIKQKLTGAAAVGGAKTGGKGAADVGPLVKAAIEADEGRRPAMVERLVKESAAGGSATNTAALVRDLTAMIDSGVQVSQMKSKKPPKHKAPPKPKKKLKPLKADEDDGAPEAAPKAARGVDGLGADVMLDKSRASAAQAEAMKNIING